MNSTTTTTNNNNNKSNWADEWICFLILHLVTFKSYPKKFSNRADGWICFLILRLVTFKSHPKKFSLSTSLIYFSKIRVEPTSKEKFRSHNHFQSQLAQRSQLCNIHTENKEIDTPPTINSKKNITGSHNFVNPTCPCQCLYT